MPRLLNPDDTDKYTLPNASFSFSAVKVKKLGATQYTLATLVVDRSGSVDGFQRDLEACIWAAVNACQMSPQAENVLLRVISFDDTITEVHGFLPLAGLKQADYERVIVPGATTALHEAMIAGIEATAEYGRELVDQDFEVNAALYFITDGLNNNPPREPSKVLEALRKLARTEQFGTVTTVLVGVNDQAEHWHEGRQQKVADVLQLLQSEAGLTQYIGLADATPKTLAQLGRFISKSISSASKALTTGGANSVPQPVTF